MIKQETHVPHTEFALITDGEELRFRDPRLPNNAIIILDDDEEMEENDNNEVSSVLKGLPESKDNSQIRLTKTVDEICSLVPPMTFKSLGPPSFTGEIIIIDDDEEETLEPNEKKPRLGFWWDDVDDFNELSSVAKGLSKSKDAASTVDPWFSSSTSLERSLSPSHHDKFIDLGEDKSTYCDSNNKEDQYCMGYGHESHEDRGVSVKDPWLGGYVKDIISPLDSWFSSSSSHLLETETNTKNGDHERSLQPSHLDDFIDLSEDEILGESSNSSNKGTRHVSHGELDDTVEDLKYAMRSV